MSDEVEDLLSVHLLMKKRDDATAVVDAEVEEQIDMSCGSDTLLESFEDLPRGQDCNLMSAVLITQPYARSPSIPVEEPLV